MSGFDAAAEVLPGTIRSHALLLPRDIRDNAAEFRLRLAKLPSIVMPDGEYRIKAAPPVSAGDLARLVELAARASPYAAASAVREGYITAANGVRVGLCGRMKPGTEETWTRRGLTSAVVRIPREVKGCGARFCKGRFVSTLILSPPGGGKTTLLRDMIRLLSDGGRRVALCDERGEVAALGPDGFGFDVGESTDVLTDRPKHAAALQLLRTMNPEILAMDEITDPRDAEACRQASGCGVALLATAHAEGERVGTCAEETRRLVAEGVFRRCIRIRRIPGGREYIAEELP